jgi:hypothetical protein
MALERMEIVKWISYILIRAGMKFRKKKKFRYGIPAYTGPFPALVNTEFYFDTQQSVDVLY